MRTTEPFIAHDASFVLVVGAAPKLQHVVDVDAHEGPVYVAAEDALYVTSLPGPGRPSRILRIALDGNRFPLNSSAISDVTAATVMPNGMTLDRDGRHLLVCEQGDLTHDACISRIDPMIGTRTVVADRWRSQRFNSPNDVVVALDGAIWFTDPSYGYLQGFRPPPEVGDHVYRCDPVTGAVGVVADGFDKPNGIALTADGRTLYVTDSGANQAPGSFHGQRPHHVEAFAVIGGNRLGGRRLLAVTAPGIPDGLKTDRHGRVFVSSDTGVLVLSPNGRLLGEFAVPGTVNFTFGGIDGRLLFITTDTAVVAAVLDDCLTN